MRVGLLWSRFGPYHLARLEGARQVAAERGDDVLGIQVATYDEAYDWRPIGDAESIATLFPGHGYDTVPRRRVKKALARTLSSSSCEVVAINGWSAAEARAAIAWRWAHPGRRVVVMSETRWDDAPRWWWKEWIKASLVKKCDAALVGGRDHVEYLSGLGFDPWRIRTGYDVVDNDYFNAGAERARRDTTSLRERYELPSRYFLACTRFLARKNVDGLLKAYSVYREALRDRAWGLVILGSGPERVRLQRRALELNLDGVKWPGFVQYDSLPVYYGLASAFVHPALAEAWGLVVNEAAASALPLIVARSVGAARELVQPGRNGWLFEAGDTGMLAETMLDVSGLSDDERHRMGLASRELVGAYSPRRFGENLFAAADLARALPER